MIKPLFPPLAAMGLSDTQIGRLAASFGIFALVREPRLLAVSTLAQELEKATLS